ncbi:MAG: hypothetical protein IKD72_01525 [Clostridia bacterium]|nr:hypothetical protein [Clostridia bacterium]
MNYKRAAEEELRQYADVRASLMNTRERIAMLEDAITSIKAATVSSTPVIGSGNQYESRLLDNIGERDRLKELYKVNLRRIKLIERGLQALTEDERKIINRFFVQNMASEAAVVTLMDETGYERAQIYRIRSRALYRYTLAEFGLPEL